MNAIDYTGVMLCDKNVIMQMIKQGKGGSIVNLSSMLGLVGIPSNVAYSAAKGGKTPIIIAIVRTTDDGVYQ